MVESTLLHGFLRSRRSIRRFRQEPVSRSILETILTTASFAPSAHNRQPWRYVVIMNQERKTALARSMAEEFLHDLLGDGQEHQEAEAQVRRSVDRISDAPVVVVLCTDFSCADEYSDSERQSADALMLVQDAALSGLQFMLAAHAEGLGTVWMCAPLFAPETLRSTLSLPDTWEPQALILSGYPGEEKTPRERRSLSDFALFI